MEKCAIYIDGAYLAKITLNRDEEGRRRNVDFGKLIKKLSEGTELVGAYYYVSMPYRGDRPAPHESERYRKMETFVYNLRQVPKLEVKMGQMIRDDQGKETQKGVDMMLGVDLTKMSCRQEIRRAVIVAADGDFVPAVRYAREENVAVHLYHYGDRGVSRTNKLLIAECGQTIEITDEFLDECRLEAQTLGSGTDGAPSS